ncbi:MAG: tRNA (adenosine(37)-N6)-threonylcarbamoyltransferase complex ATPase subunit type 1 TsaE, partial [Candidatus Paceibacteria bacterium]
IHIDAYCLESASELKSLGWEEISKNSKNIIFIEWPENVKEILPKDKQEIHFKFIDENTREILW